MSAQPIPLYLRRYQVDVALPDRVVTVTSDEFEPDALRCTFDIQQRAFQIFWTAEISFYNLSEDLNSEIMGALEFQQIEVTVQAGYKKSDQGYGVIWRGPAFQPLFEREGVVDTKLTLHCILGLGPVGRNFISQSFSKITQAELVQKIADQAFSKIPVAKVSDKLKTTPLPRGKVVFGPPRKYLTQIAEDANAQWWFGPDGLVVSSFTDADIPSDPSLTFTPPALPSGNAAGGNNPASPSDGTIIGTPQQTPFGVIFRALLDARVFVSKPFIAVKIDNSQIRKLKAFPNPGQSPQISVLDKDGVYIVAGVRFIGDNRGNDWYVEVDGFTKGDRLIEMMQAQAAANTNGG